MITPSRVLMPVPVKPDLFPLLVNYSAHKLHYFARAIGVAWPTVSQTQTARAPQRIAVVYSARIVSGSARVVSSVTNITGKPSFTATSLPLRSFQKFVERPLFGVETNRRRADERAGLDGMPARREISTMGMMSFLCVRAAQLDES